MRKRISLGYILLQTVTGLLLVVLWLTNLLPFRIKLAIGKGFGRLLYAIPNSRLAITKTNLALCFPKQSEVERNVMAREVFVNFGAGCVETMMSWWDNPAKIHRMTEIRGQHHIEEALKQSKGLILIGAHFSTLDLCGLLFAKYYQYFAIYRTQSNGLLNWVMMRGRARNMLGCIPHTSMRSAAKEILKGNIVWYSPDQDMGKDYSVFAPFFGHPAATLTATAKLARLTKAPIVMLASHRKADDSGYVLECFPGPVDFPTVDEEANATKINQLIEQGISLSPSQYYWFHRRFKTQPGLEKAEIYRDSRIIQ